VKEVKSRRKKGRKEGRKEGRNQKIEFQVR
jgi:hypothetical protein